MIYICCNYDLYIIIVQCFFPMLFDLGRELIYLLKMYIVLLEALQWEISIYTKNLRNIQNYRNNMDRIKLDKKIK